MAEWKKALGVIELLENILVHLPICDLFLVQRVSKSWRNTIIGSIKLQQRMWLLPNGDVREDCRFFCVAQDRQEKNQQCMFLGFDKQKVHPNLLVLDILKGCRRSHAPMRLDADSSFRKMLLTSPPVDAMNLELLSRDRRHGKLAHGRHWTRCRLNAPEGSTFRRASPNYLSLKAPVDTIITAGTVLDLIEYDQVSEGFEFDYSQAGVTDAVAGEVALQLRRRANSPASSWHVCVPNKHE